MLVVTLLRRVSVALRGISVTSSISLWGISLWGISASVSLGWEAPTIARLLVSTTIARLLGVVALRAVVGIAGLVCVTGAFGFASVGAVRRGLDVVATFEQGALWSFPLGLLGFEIDVEPRLVFVVKSGGPTVRNRRLVLGVLGHFRRKDKLVNVIAKNES